VIDRSLDASRFREVTGYLAPSWEEMIQSMYDFQ
jgi:dTDP-4-dehydrorhamnose reductase